MNTRRSVAAVVLAVLGALLLALPTSGVSSTGGASGDEPLATLRANLTGEKEVPGPGDPDGRGSATIKVFKTQVCHTLKFDNIRPATMAHIHIGFRDEAGPVILTLFGPPAPPIPSPGTSTGCQDVPRALSLELREHPGRYYVNVHNERFPNGAIRGQLYRP
jgi:hypothetical protein